MTAQLIIRLFGPEDLTEALEGRKNSKARRSSSRSRKRACLRLECVSESRWPGPWSATGWRDSDLRKRFWAWTSFSFLRFPSTSPRSNLTSGSGGWYSFTSNELCTFYILYVTIVGVGSSASRYSSDLIHELTGQQVPMAFFERRDDWLIDSLR